MKQRFIINKDLHMTKGKIAAQACHGEFYYMDKMCYGHSYGTMHDNHIKWKKEDMPKIILKATEQEMIEIETDLKEKGIWTHRVYDLGLTQVPENSFTCLVIEPIEANYHYCIKTIDHPNNIYDKLNSLKLL